MSLVINTNTMSLNAQRNLSKSNSSLSTSMERLSSGLRINKAADDAAGLAIASRMTTQISGMTQAARNANDGISLAQTAEGALSELTNNLQRIRELAVQAANDTNSTSDREALDAEVQQRLAEINRSASQTSFNGRKVLDGSFGDATFQVGANVGETIGIALNTDMRTSAIGATASAAGTVDLSTLFTSGGSAATAASYDSGTVAAADYSSTSLVFTVTVPGGSAQTVTLTDDYTSSGLAQMATDIQSQLTGATVSQASGVFTFTASTAGAGSIAIGGADAATFTTGGTSTAGAATVSGTAAAYTVGAFTLQVGDDTAVSLAGSYDTAQDLVDAINSNVSGVYASLNDSGQLELSSSEDLTIGAGAGTTALGLASGVVAASGDLTTVNVLTADGANDAIQRIDAALDEVNTLRGTLGAIQNRFESAVASVETTTENLTSARSRIQDADFASETAAMTSAQVLQQAGISVLSQANSSQQNILKLLQ